jgi:hypothetical protein
VDSHGGTPRPELHHVAQPEGAASHPRAFPGLIRVLLTCSGLRVGCRVYRSLGITGLFGSTRGAVG